MAQVARAMLLRARAATTRDGAQRALLKAGCGASHGALMPHPRDPSRLRMIAASRWATQLLAAYFARRLMPGDCYLLYGDVGAGKSYFR